MFYNRLLSSSASSDEDRNEQRERRRRPRLLLQRRNPFGEFDDVDFKTRFRLSKDSVDQLLHLIGNQLHPLSNRNRPIDVRNQVLIALRFYATGSFQICTGDHFNVSKATVCRIVRKVSHYIALLRPQFLQMPQNRNELNKVQNDFYHILRFPRVLGAIDCTHIKIQAPGGEHGELFRNRKGWFSINVQATCNAQLKFIDIVARWPGSVHDSTIFNDSLLRARLENNEFPDCYLLGDSGYACKKYLLTPLLNPQTRSEQAYNRAHIRTRNVIERAFGVWKRRFPCLSVGMRIKEQTTLAVIVATAVLHNMAIGIGDEVPNEEIPIALEQPELQLQELPNTHNAVRTALINTVF
ncbi:putative nuclease HARBI1 [Diabrotica virgifera virgifera]|uniref:DDE Tnp4 domain-containing protein n=1 Tax=Diabrotica virgifera virgifera TaxID=50390 RepID=A0ABM5K4A7_DIAVI|nr:putative nuclease HARBI1 [Diabrotica virgifera virgifera]